MSVCVSASVAKAWLFDEFFFDSSLLRRILKTLQRVFISSRTNPCSESLLSLLFSSLSPFFVSLSLGHSSFLQSYSRSKSTQCIRKSQFPGRHRGASAKAENWWRLLTPLQWKSPRLFFVLQFFLLFQRFFHFSFSKFLNFSGLLLN